MGNVSSRPEEGNPLYAADQTRFSVTSLAVTNSRNRTLLNITPNSFPATQYNAKREAGDDSVVEYIQDPESSVSGAPPAFLIRLSNEDELVFNFTFVVRQAQASSIYPVSNGASATANGLPDTVINGLTYIFGSNTKDLDNLVTREFHADPNFHKNPNVHLVGDYSTGGSASIQFQWSWRWRPPRTIEDKGGGWRNSCSFVEYDQRAHKFDTLASFSFWVHNTQRLPNSPQSRSPRLEMSAPHRLRVPSAQSIESRVSTISDSDAPDYRDYREPQSPNAEAIPEYGLGLVPTMTNNTVVACQRPGEDPSATEDGPVFRATMKQLEQKTGNMRTRMKKVLKKAEAAQEAQTACNDAVAAFTEALREASSSNANAVKPALDHYFEKIAKEILSYERQNTVNLQRLIIDPITKLYTIDIKQAESRKKDFEEEAKDFYGYVGRYLGQRQDSMKEKKREESDTKYQAKRRTFELKRFDYSSFMHDLHGGRKDQEVLSQLTKYADAQAKAFLSTARKVEEMIPQLEALSLEVQVADKEFQLQRTEREEKRRALEKSTKAYGEPEGNATVTMAPSTPAHQTSIRKAEQEPGSAASVAPIFRVQSASPQANGTGPVQLSNGYKATSPGNQPIAPVSSPNQNRFRGIRDLEEREHPTAVSGNAGQYRKEGLLWALSRPGSHADPKGLNKTAWHKFWIVLDQGKLSEYSNWKDKLELHREPIDLRVASVREARAAERRFCFEVITPQYTRVYQATTEEEMKIWISAINNALQSAFETKRMSPEPVSDSSSGSNRRDIAAVLTGKSSSYIGHRANSSGTATSASKPVSRHATVGDAPSYRRANSTDANPSALLQQIRDADAGNKNCVDCGSDSKVEWVSINLGIILCIECSGIHRSLGTHISKVRSLTLDTSAFTPDIIDILLSIGNRVSNMIWEARLDRTQKPGPQSTREQRLRFITSKYAEKAFVQPISATLSHFSTAEETLLASIKKNDIQNVLYALALRASPNATDRSRNTHAVFLALAAADPASPAPSASYGSSPPSMAKSSPRAEAATQPRKPFPIAEILLQNGADLPSLPAPIPLSRAAQLYLDYKIDQRTGRHLDIGARDVNGDILTALPSIVAGNGSTPGERARERDKMLLKRRSDGTGRLVKPMTALDHLEGKR
ncbi:ARF GTPase-like protein activator [Cryomyces antarcticus]